MIKTVILLIVVAIIAFFALKSVYKLLTGKGGCDCGGGHGTDHKCSCSGGCSSCGAHHHEEEK